MRLPKTYFDLLKVWYPILNDYPVYFFLINLLFLISLNFFLFNLFLFGLKFQLLFSFVLIYNLPYYNLNIMILNYLFHKL